MTRSPLLALVFLGLASAAHAQTAPASKKLYCWNEGGRKVCGDALPSSAVDAARTEINAKSGMATSQVGRALTPEERAAAAAQAKADADNAAAEEAEHRRLMAMIETFATEADLRKAFGERVSLNADAMKTARMGIDGLRQSLVALLQRAGEMELNKKPVPKKLAGDIRAQHDQLLVQQAALVTLQSQAATLQSQLEDAVARYRELKPQAAVAATPAG
ncbi:hypothetical protein DWG18_12505 [Lysobacter sp. TY2-98]|uniref:hypothetical protein n=1 Tax=Lysobacter sp. TY2-98 TaxID=2290922 RepID=UPI000E20594C|nr:hypothetical protein [Lysobacter sp. TY2-98]AXK73017.1 hypothetical protein DWG18_12505 [Lysobacter sp. TY2-98]